MIRMHLSLMAILAVVLALPTQARSEPLAVCAQCHTLSESDVPDDLISHRLTREAPDLHYAGAKFNEEWLVHWLQKPTRIRPAGVFFGRHVEASENGQDVVATEGLPEHPAFGEEDARAIAAALMQKREGVASLIPEGAYSGKGNVRFGKMAFNKLRGCVACHENAPGEGGVSGPELHSASIRLQPDFIATMIAKPQEIEPRSWMPHLQMSDRDVQNLTAYLMSLDVGEEQ
ncbi:MAG: cytochrome C [Rhodobiaceae bacterium]|nr:cytochrome C [Rhodobiaceae bacterium]